MIAAFEALCSPKPGRTLIVGSHIRGAKEDRRKRYTDCVGVDMEPGPGVDVVLDLETGRVDGELFAHIECMSVLEHCKRPWLMANNLEMMLQRGGTMFITVPFVWRVHNYPDDYWRMSVSGIKALFHYMTWEQESYSHRTLCKAEDIPAVKAGEDWPYFARTEACVFGRRK